MGLRTFFSMVSCLLLAPIALAQSQNDVDIKLLQYGVGNVFRPGEVVGIEIELTSNLPSDETVWVQWDHETSDGDIVAFGRRETISPGQPRTTWLYVPLLPTTNLNTQGRLRVRALDDGEPGQDLGVLLFEPTIATPRQLARASSLIGVIGTKIAGLEAYEQSPEFMRGHLVASEPTAVGLVASSSQLPDRWMGLKPFESLIWTNAKVDLSPAEEEALLEWMRRGGHLVIVLPQSGNPWNLGAGADGPLGSIMPAAPVRHEAVPLGTILPSLLKRDPLVNPSGTMPVQAFRNNDQGIDVAPISDGWCDLWDLDGVGTLAIQKPVGQGRISIIGVDVTAAPLREAALSVPFGATPVIDSVPEADVFWNRILGRRADSPSSRAVGKLRDQDRLTMIEPSTRFVGDNVILSETQYGSRVGSGLLTAFLLFLAYWVVAVPMCWYILKRRKLLHWSWVGFFASAMLFTAIAWVSVAFLRESNVRIQHLTVLNHVHGEDQQRAVSWMSVFTPGYGDYDLAIDGSGDDLLVPWEPDEIRLAGFPDTRQTSVDVGRFSNRLTIPSRATTTSIQADWRGPIASSNWGDILRMDQERPIHVQRDRFGKAVGLRGSIKSELPQMLENVQILFVDQPRPTPRLPDVVEGIPQPWVRPSQSGRMERQGWAWAVPNTPPAGHVPLDNLELDTAQFDLEDTLRKRYSDPVQVDVGTPMRPLGKAGVRRALEALTFFHQMEPPHWIRPSGDRKDRDWAITQRTGGRELDLSAWMTRPVLIVTGFLQDSKLPFPLLVEGEPPASSEGLVMVRWIFPIQEEAPPPGS